MPTVYQGRRVTEQRHNSLEEEGKSMYPLYMFGNTIYLLLFIDILFTVGAQLSLRYGASRMAASELNISFFIDIARNIYILGGLALFGVSFFLYVFILSRLQLSIAYPIATGSVLALITVGSHFLFKEALTTTQAIGIAAIFIGVILILLPR